MFKINIEYYYRDNFRAYVYKLITGLPVNTYQIPARVSRKLRLAFIMYQAIKQIGGSWAGAGITIGASLLISSLFELDLLIDPQIVSSIMVVALVVGILSFLMRHRGHYFSSMSSFSKKTCCARNQT